ncbi:MAG TPA: phosphatidate cytidylyltransferase [Acidobacteria bacterium]|nr:phosphatidate cytidylyltransferase [Acidobacteriota bacterium]
MARVLSGVVMIAIVVGATWWLSVEGILVLAGIVLVIAGIEYCRLTFILSTRLLTLLVRLLIITATLATSALVARVDMPTAAVMATTFAIGSIALTRQSLRHDERWYALVAIMFAPLYLGLPMGSFVAIRTMVGSEAILLILATLVASDTTQYYGGRMFGQRLLAPIISPKKTVEGALLGVAAGTLVFTIIGAWWLPNAAWWLRILFGLVLVGAGIVGDLFESSLKRAARVKDVSSLIPGHGGVLDRLDSFLFAMPLYYLILGTL